MKTVSEAVIDIKKHISRQKKYAFFATVIIGIFVHMAILVSDYPNHDGLASIYFDQNMITSGRWFLTIACGISSYFTIPWLIGVLGIFYLGITAVLLVDITEVKSTFAAVFIGGLLASFPALASTFAYVFTLDGYMLALLMAVAAVAVTKKYKFGFIPGAILLSLSLGTYQAYLPFAILLCVYMVVLILMKAESIKKKLFECLHYLYMGIIGATLYYVMLKVLLAIEGKELDTYQGINSLESAGSSASSSGIVASIKSMYLDFAQFTLVSDVFVTNIFCLVALALIALTTLYVFIKLVKQKRYYKSPWLYVVIVLLIALVPVVTNVVMLISSDVNYHLIMRYQWVLFPILMIAFIDRFSDCMVFSKTKTNLSAIASWAVCFGAIIMIFSYAVADNIGYSNLSKKYEKTYAYCIRLLDRIEQTEGYYQGIPIVMIGVISDDEYPSTDVTVGVTDNMIGLSGDYLVYKNMDYKSFIANYLGASLNFVDGDIITEVYYSDEYRAMESFPSADSIKVIDGKMIIKTENMEK